MIAVDSSSLIAFLNGLDGPDVQALRIALASSDVALPPIVMAEVLSDPRVPRALVQLLRSLTLLELTPGFWERAGMLRARVRTDGRRAPLADSLIAQCCLDHEIALITRDRDFTPFASIVKLHLVVSQAIDTDTPRAAQPREPRKSRKAGDDSGPKTA